MVLIIAKHFLYQTRRRTGWSCVELACLWQGEVEQIAMMKPKAQTEHEDGMLEFLEDIIGSNRFKQPIAMLCQRVETLNELRAEKVSTP